MISNLYIFVLYYISIPISLIGYGLFFFALNKNLKISSNYGYAGLTGLLILCIYSYLSSLFISHSELHNFLILLLGLFCFFYFKFKNNDQNKLLSLLLIVYFLGFLIFKTHDDFPYYHFNYSYYLTQMPTTMGIGNFNLGLRTPSSIFYLNSLFYLPITKYFLFQMSAFSIFLFSNIILLNKIFPKNLNNKSNFLTFYYLLSFIFINIFFYRISEHGTDRSAQILMLILIGEILFFVNFKSIIEKVLSKLFLLIAIIISLKAFYVLYIVFFSLILFNLNKKFKFKKTFIYLISNYYFYFLIILFILILGTNFINTGCLIYPVNFTCFEEYSWAISKSEVKELNDWYEQWSKAGAGPNFRVENSEVYIEKFNWVSNWINEYFFTKVSDFILGLTILSFIILSCFSPYAKGVTKYRRNIIFTLTLIVILFLEWFYNHPTLRYGGYCLVASFTFVLISIKLEKSSLSKDKAKKRVVYLIIFSIVVFMGRNINRISKEYNQYNYNPLKNVFYYIDESYFDLDKKMKSLKKAFNDCKSEKTSCKIDERYSVKKISNFYVFYINK
tara:strand:+ start:113 stop:1789 length:1677 start_codon:yes stop_codon:yes gene_type:complete